MARLIVGLPLFVMSSLHKAATAVATHNRCLPAHQAQAEHAIEAFAKPDHFLDPIHRHLTLNSLQPGDLLRSIAAVDDQLGTGDEG